MGMLPRSVHHMNCVRHRVHRLHRVHLVDYFKLVPPPRRWLLGMHPAVLAPQGTACVALRVALSAALHAALRGTAWHAWHCGPLNHLFLYHWLFRAIKRFSGGFVQLFLSFWANLTTSGEKGQKMTKKMPAPLKVLAYG